MPELVDFCTEQHKQSRCILLRGHDGAHECIIWHTGEAFTWEDADSDGDRKS